MKKKLDIATLVGIVAGMLLICSAMLMGGGIAMFINIPSFFIVVGGTAAATLVNFPLKEVLGVSKVAMNSFFAASQSPDEMIKQLVNFSGIAKKNGMLALEEAAKKVTNPLLKTGLGYLTDGFTPEEVESGMRLQLIAMQSRHKVGQDVFKGMGKWAPAFGMIGTLIGLVQMLATMDDPKSIGPKMAVALLTTFYGALLANLVFLPIAGKLARRTEIEMVIGRLISEGLVSILAGTSPMLMEGRLRAFLQTELQKIKEKGGKSKGSAPSKPKKAAAAVS